MNKLLLSMIALFGMFPLVAIEKEAVHEYALKPITRDESNGFVKYAKSALTFSDKAVEDKKIAPDNALHIITYKYNQYLILSNNNLSEMIQQQGLQGRLEEFNKFEFGPGVVKIKDTILGKNNDDLEANRKEADSLFKGKGVCFAVSELTSMEMQRLKESLIARRKLLAAINLKKKQSTYVIPTAGDANARVNSMLENKNYPLNEEAIKDYIAALIYRQVLSRRTAIYILQEKKAAVVEEL